jgi:hypothetical protein
MVWKVVLIKSQPVGYAFIFCIHVTGEGTRLSSERDFGFLHRRSWMWTVFWDVAPCSQVEVPTFQRCLLLPSSGRIAPETSALFYQTTRCNVPGDKSSSRPYSVGTFDKASLTHGRMSSEGHRSLEDGTRITFQNVVVLIDKNALGNRGSTPCHAIVREL